ncbi:Uu.00g084340.m01.CDS01 [Anthostomella pinea]|uniref:Uu.00g084340.m01.CDS01 n=1 Tax=Anthostomella pinea TaxID=933095 RepID=A0AAI8YJU1_9PEZI|nr:Uu.00g084340.m01.CDS01 [Anthostomella pinea]
MLSPSFSLGNIRRLEPILRVKTQELCRLIDQHIDPDGEGSAGSIDCAEPFSKATLDIMGVLALGVELSNLTSDKGDKNEYSFHEAYKTILAPDKTGSSLLFINGFFPIRWLPIQANREFLRATRWVRNALTQLIRTRHRDVREARAAGKDIACDSRDILTFMATESLLGGAAEC